RGIFEMDRTKGAGTAVSVPARLESEPRAVRAPPSALALTTIAVIGCAAATYSFVAALRNPLVGAALGEPLVVTLLAKWLTVSYILCGLYAWWRRPESRFGPLMVAAGFVNFLSTLSWTTNDLTFTLGQALDLLPPVLFMHVFLAFPSGHLRDSFERALVASAYVAAVVLQVSRMTFGYFGPHNLLEITANEGAALLTLRVSLLTMSAFCLAAVGVLVLRRRRRRTLRRSRVLLVDAFALGLVMIAFLYISAAFDGPAVRQIRWATFATLGLAPIVFLAALLKARLDRSAVGDLFLELRSEPAPGDLRDAFARALRDPSLQLAYWLPDYECYADLRGRPVELQDLDGRATTLIDLDGEHVAALIHDPALEDEPELLDSVQAAAGIALENGRLHAELQARLEELRGSRARIVEAARNERQLLERNLHDGAQQRLIALSLNLSLLKGRIDGDPAVTGGIDQARREIAASLNELREIARGIHPAVVSGHGLAVALEQLAARAPVPVESRVEIDGRLPEPLELAAYYVVSESLTNIAKHAEATTARIDVVKENGELVLEIVDDGIGGADSERGTGLRGLADRVEALNGRLRVWTPRGGGTRVRAEIPCR
ncbi:MAG TPA: histidine kinase, partial [Gaiellaceae bacterium]|nr:histidine kinase [Gaiellaceae bacterium]